MNKRSAAKYGSGASITAAAIVAFLFEVSCEKTTPQQDLYDAARSCDSADATAAIKAGADVNAAEAESKKTPLMWAAFSGCIEPLKSLLSAGADANSTITAPPIIAGVAVPSEVGDTAVYEATTRPGRPDIIRALAAVGADLDKPEADGSHPIDMAVLHGEFETVRALVESGADINARMGVLTPLSIALMDVKDEDNGMNGTADDRIKIVKYLQAKGAQ